MKTDQFPTLSAGFAFTTRSGAARTLLTASTVLMLLSAPAALLADATEATSPTAAVASPVSPAERYFEVHTLAGRLNSFVLVYNGFRRSMIEPCGCVTTKLGGMDKEASLLHALRGRSIPYLQVEAGGFLREGANSSMMVKSAYILRSLAKMDAHAVNVSAADLSTGLRFLQDAQSTTGLTFISANIVGPDEKPLFDPYTIVSFTLRDGQEVRVAIVGLTRALPPGGITNMAKPDGTEYGKDYTIQPPVEVATKVIPEARKEAPIVILAHYDSPGEVRNFISALPEEALPDVVIAGEYLKGNEGMDMLRGVRFVASGFEGRHVGRMVVDVVEGHAASAEARHFEVIPNLPSDTNISQFVAAAVAEARQVAIAELETGDDFEFEDLTTSTESGAE